MDVKLRLKIINIYEELMLTSLENNSKYISLGKYHLDIKI